MPMGNLTLQPLIYESNIIVESKISSEPEKRFSCDSSVGRKYLMPEQQQANGGFGRNRQPSQGFGTHTQKRPLIETCQRWLSNRCAAWLRYHVTAGRLPWRCQGCCSSIAMVTVYEEVLPDQYQQCPRAGVGANALGWAPPLKLDICHTHTLLLRLIRNL